MKTRILLPFIWTIAALLLLLSVLHGHTLPPDDTTDTTVPQSIASRVTQTQVTLIQVELTPDFVDAGSGVSYVRLHLMNHSGLPVATTAVARLLDSAGQVQRQFEMSLAVPPRPTPTLIGEFDLNGLRDGTYTAVVTLQDEQAAIASNYAPLAIGQGLRLTHSPRLQTMPPGQTAVFTTIFTTTRAILTHTVSFDPVVKWTAVFPQEPTFNQVAMMPAVGDVTGDGLPDVVFSTYAGQNYANDGILRIYRGDTGAPIASVTDPGQRVHPLSSPVLVDLDNDGLAEIVAMLSGGGLAAFSGNGQLQYSSVPTFTLAPQQGMMPVVTDLDQDGRPEIIVGRFVLDHTLSQLTVLGPASGSETDLLGGIVADANLDGAPEVIVANTIYAASGGILHQNPAAPGLGSVAVGNFDADPFPEIVLVDPFSNGRLFLLDHHMNLIWGPVIIPTTGSPFGNGGPPTIADFDGDGWPEIGVAGDKHYVVFDGDGSILWQQPTQDLSSGFTGSAVFDFQGDGRAEVVYADETALSVYNGADGAVLFSTPHSSITGYELPVVADVDADGAAEIVLVDNNAFFGSFTGVRVFEAADDSWVNTRQVWHQHAYDVTSVNDDLQIVSQPTPVWLLHNTFRSQAPTPGQGDAYFVEVVHTLSPTGTQLLTDTLSPPPLAYDATTIHWLYPQQERVELKVGQLEQLAVPSPGPGMARALSAGTAVTYTIGGETSQLLLPPFYAITPHIVDLTPQAITVTAPANARYTIYLTNTFTTPQTFTLTLHGVPAEWAVYESVLNLAAGEMAQRPLTVTLPIAITPPLTYTLLLAVATGSGTDAVSAALIVTAPDEPPSPTWLYLPLVAKPAAPPPPIPTPTRTPIPVLPACNLIPVILGNPPGIDLVITDLRLTPATVRVGETAVVQVTIKNQGQQAVAAGNNFYVDFYVNPAQEPPPLFQTGILSWPVQGGQMAAGASLTLTGSYTFGAAGTYRLWAQVDTDASVPTGGGEADETNNVYGCYGLTVQSAGG